MEHRPAYLCFVAHRIRISLLGALLAWCLLPWSGLAQQVLVDINTALQGPEVRELASTGEKAFIAGRDGSLWVSDEAVTELRRIRAIDVPPSRRITHSRALFAFGDRVLIRVEASIDNVHYEHLWISDGTEAGTRPLMQGTIYAGDGVEMVQAGSSVYFHVSRASFPNGTEDHGEWSYSIWRTDGTPEGTRHVVDTGDASRSFPMVSTGGHVLFTQHLDQRRMTVASLHVASGAVIDLFPGEDIHSEMLGSIPGMALFEKGDPAHGNEPWISDGTLEGTRLLADIVPGPQGSSPRLVGMVRNRIVFQAAGQLWSISREIIDPKRLLDTVNVARYNPDSPSAATAGGLLFFGSEGVLWATDGTSDGTYQLPGPDALVINPWSFTAFGQQVFFQGVDARYGTELWTSDGTADGTRRLTDLRSGPVGVNRLLMTSTHAGLLVAPWPSGPLAPVMYYGGVDGSLRDARFVVGDHSGPGSDPDEFQGVETGVLFTANRAGHGREVWFSNGLPDGTHVVSEPEPDGSPSEYQLLGALPDGILALNAGSLGVFDPGTGSFNVATDVSSGPVRVYDTAFGGDHALLLAASAASTPEFWLTDGTAGGTRQVTAYDNGSLWRQGIPLARVGEQFMFAVDHGKASTLYVVNIPDGTVSEVLTGIDSSALRMSVLHHAEAHIVLSTEAGLLQTDGTPYGTRLWDIKTNYWTSRNHVTQNGTTFFTPGFPMQGELWTTDGTEEGTHLVEQLCPPDQGCEDPYSFVASNEAVYFLHEPRGLWKSDGTPEGTIWSSLQPSLLDDMKLLASNHEALILEVRQRYVDGVRARSLWLFDTTRDRFEELLDADAWMGSRLANISKGRIMGDRFVFVADRPDVGRELFYVDLENPLAVLASSGPEHPDSIELAPPYPNPASSAVHLGVNLPRADHVRMELFDALGRRVALWFDDWMPAGKHDLKASTRGLSAGVYFIRVQAGRMILSERIAISR